MILTENEKKAINSKLSKFLKQYGEYYKEDPAMYYYIQKMFIPSLELGASSDILIEIYQELELSKYLRNDYYSTFIKHMQEEFEIDNNLLEVACGIIPSLANKIRKQQKSGSITVMDPMVIEEYKADITIKKETFTEKTDVSKYDLIYSFYPCESTPEMIKSSFKNDKDLFLELCGCVHTPGDYLTEKKFPNNYRVYLEYLEYLLAKLSTSNRKYEITNYSDLDFKVIKTYKSRNYM